jgi:hypothetical protein
VVEYALTRIPPEKIYLGIPNYGYDWRLPYVSGESRAKSISNVEAVELARRYGAEILFDEVAESPYFNYTDEEGGLHEVHFEDARSISAKLSLLSEYSLYGAGYAIRWCGTIYRRCRGGSWAIYTRCSGFGNDYLGADTATLRFALCKYGGDNYGWSACSDVTYDGGSARNIYNTL